MSTFLFYFGFKDLNSLLFYLFMNIYFVYFLIFVSSQSYSGIKMKISENEINLELK